MSMKRRFLTTVLATVATAAMAQLAEPALMDVGESEFVANVSSEKEVSTPHRSKASGLWYTKPLGAMYRHYYTNLGQTTSNTYIYIPYYEDFTYVNRSTNPTTCRWYVYNTSSATFEENTENVDDQGNFVPRLSAGYGLAIPRLTDRFVTEEYSMPYYSDNVGFAAGSGWFANDTYPDDGYYGWMAFVDNKHVYGTGSFDNHYLFGSSTATGSWQGYDSEGRTSTVYGTFPMNAVYQNYPAPISPLYVDCVYVDGQVWSDTRNPEPLANGATLTLELYDLYTGELLETLTATTGDYTEWNYYSSGTYGAYSYGYMKFSKKEDDPLFGSSEVPFVLDRAVQAVITGWDGDGVNFGIHAPVIQDCDYEAELGEAMFTVKDTTGKIVYPFTYTYSLGLAIALKFHAIMDNASVAETLTWVNGYGEENTISGYNVVRISDDGTTCENEDIPSAYNFNGLYVQTTMPWFDDNGFVENYTLSDSLEDWGLDISVEEYGSSTNTYRLSFTANAINEGEGRSAVVYLQGKGFTSSVPIHLLQGDISVEDGISSVSAEQPKVAEGTYNLAGQRVSQTTKGLIIKNGKKIINK